MEKELETAQAVQSRFLPPSRLSYPNAEVSGCSLSASECGGDWWYHAQVGDRLILVQGDVTGHGVSAALITAAVYNSFSLFIQNARSGLLETPLLEALAKQLNWSVWSAAHGGASMSMVLFDLDLKSGTLEWINAGHCTPFLIRNGTYLSLIEGRCDQLGSNEGFEGKPSRVSLEPGDTIFAYTDGLFEERRSDRTKMRKLDLLRSMCTLAQGEGFQPVTFSEWVSRQAQDHFGEDPEGRPDDITACFIGVPRPASFVRRAA
jgi:sigma-B regulation protein RsbU (phosphoserine phosphatase)